MLFLPRRHSVRSHALRCQGAPRSSRVRSRAMALLLVAATCTAATCTAAGCSAARTSRPKGPPNYPWKLRPPSAFDHDFLWRQQLQARFGLRKIGFQAVLQRRGNSLTLLGLGPANSKAFVLKQDGDKLDFHSYMPRKLPFPPRFVLIDIQRAWLPLTTQMAPQDGKRTILLPGERLVETWKRGRLIRRSFVRLDDKPKGQILIDYQAPKNPGAVPGVVVLKNGWFGYALRIETLEARDL